MDKAIDKKTFRDNLIFTYKHHKIQVDEKLQNVFPKNCNMAS